MFFNIIFEILCTFILILYQIIGCHVSERKIWKNNIQSLKVYLKIDIILSRTALDTRSKLQIPCFQPSYFFSSFSEKRNIKWFQKAKLNIYGIWIGPRSTPLDHRTIDVWVDNVMTRWCDDGDAMSRKCDDDYAMAR